MSRRFCKGCDQDKELNEVNFYPRVRINKDGSTRAWFQHRCKICHSKLSNSARTKIAPKDQSIRQIRKLAKRFGATPEEIESVVIRAFDACEVCGGQPTKGKYRLALDHNHETGKMRGVLCMGCNTTLGLVKDSPTILRNLADYLEKYADKL